MGVVLTSTYHDADARLPYMLEDCVSKLRRLYSGIGVVVSPLTHESARRRLTEFGVDVHSSPENGRGYVYCKALEAGLQSGGECIHYCDWDRVLHWVTSYPSELSKILQRRLDCECLILERARVAHRSHQPHCTIPMSPSTGSLAICSAWIGTGTFWELRLSPLRILIFPSLTFPAEVPVRELLGPNTDHSSRIVQDRLKKQPCLGVLRR